MQRGDDRLWIVRRRAESLPLVCFVMVNGKADVHSVLAENALRDLRIPVIQKLVGVPGVPFRQDKNVFHLLRQDGRVEQKIEFQRNRMVRMRPLKYAEVAGMTV